MRPVNAAVCFMHYQITCNHRGRLQLFPGCIYFYVAKQHTHFYTHFDIPLCPFNSQSWPMQFSWRMSVPPVLALKAKCCQPTIGTRYYIVVRTYPVSVVLTGYSLTTWWHDHGWRCYRWVCSYDPEGEAAVDWVLSSCISVKHIGRIMQESNTNEHSLYGPVSVRFVWL